MEPEAGVVPGAEAIRQQLDRILSSRIFFASLRSRDFLRYAVEKSLLNGAAPKEYEIAVEVFGRSADYDPTVDATVRVEASRLRSRLREYYDTEGRLDSILIEMPKGGYTATFSSRGLDAAPVSREHSDAGGPASNGTPFHHEPNGSAATSNHPFRSRLSDHRGLLTGLACACVIAALFLGWLVMRRTEASEPIRSLAVLPLQNLSGDHSQDYFADGMTDELTTELAHIRGLRVISRTSAATAAGLHEPLPQIARDLNVDAIVEGSVLRSGDKVRITAQLIDARKDRHLWAGSFEGQSSDILSLQDSIADQIASQARIALMDGQGRGRTARKINPAAHDAYLLGLYFFQKQDWQRSEASFRQAVAIDPSYASAYAGLGAALDGESTFQMGPPDELLHRALAATERAIQLDPENGEAYTELGSIQTLYQWNWHAAEENLRRGIALNPNYALGEMKYAVYLDATGQPEEAVEHMRRAVDLDPMSFFMRRRLGATLYLARHYDEALTELKRAAEMEPEQNVSYDYWMGLTYEMKGMRNEAVREDLASLKAIWPKLDLAKLDSAYKSQGWKAYWRARIDALRPYANRECVPYGIAIGYVRLGDHDDAFSFLNQAVDQHCVEILWLKADPLLDPIRNDSRFNTLLRKVNLSN